MDTEKKAVRPRWEVAAERLGKLAPVEIEQCIHKLRSESPATIAMLEAVMGRPAQTQTTAFDDEG